MQALIDRSSVKLGLTFSECFRHLMLFLKLVAIGGFVMSVLLAYGLAPVILGYNITCVGVGLLFAISVCVYLYFSQPRSVDC